MILIVVLVIVAFFAVRALYVLGSVPTFKWYWNHQNAQVEQAGTLKVVALGDSTVQGIGALLPSTGLAGRVASLTASLTGKKVQLYNFSLTGGKMADVASMQLQQAKTVKNPDLIIIAVGPNDVTGGTQRADFIKQYKKLLVGLPADKVVIATIPPLERRKISNETVLAWNDALKDLAAENNAKVADVYSQIYPRRHNQLIYAGDFFHPSTYGYRFWEAAFEPPVQKILKP